MAKKRSGRQSNRVIDMRPGHSGDPFFEAQRRLNENTSQYNINSRVTRLNQQTGGFEGAHIEELYDMQEPSFLPHPLSNVSNPFAPLQEFIYSDQGLIPIGRPWLDNGHINKFGTPRSGGRTGHMTTFKESKPPQKSLTTQKKGRLKKRP